MMMHTDESSVYLDSYECVTITLDVSLEFQRVLFIYFHFQTEKWSTHCMSLKLHVTWSQWCFPTCSADINVPLWHTFAYCFCSFPNFPVNNIYVFVYIVQSAATTAGVNITTILQFYYWCPYYFNSGNLMWFCTRWRRRACRGCTCLWQLEEGLN